MGHATAEKVSMTSWDTLHSLGGGFKHCLFLSLPGEDSWENSDFHQYFSKGLNPPTSFGNKETLTRIEPMYFLLKMGIFQPAMLVYQRVFYFKSSSSNVFLRANLRLKMLCVCYVFLQVSIYAEGRTWWEKDMFTKRLRKKQGTMLSEFCLWMFFYRVKRIW